MGADLPHPLAAIGWRGPPPRERCARVVAQHRSGYVVDDGRRRFAVSAPAALIRAGGAAEDRPAVGDFVVLEPRPHDHIVRVLPRRSVVRRGAAGERCGTQIIAANVDRVLIVVGLDTDFNLRRIERYVVLARDGGAEPVVVLTKADRCTQDVVAARYAEVAARLPGVAVAAINAKDAASAAALAPWLGPGDTAVLVGSSGAGKSTLTNTLLGWVRQATGRTRAHDGRGRHTTTQRDLLRLPGGACLIDTPGMRELKLTGDEAIDALDFPDIAALAADCRFRDCRHEAEPGCAVQAAIAEGRLDADRLAHLRKLAAEHAAARDQRRSLAARRRLPQRPPRVLPPRAARKPDGP